MSEAPSERLGEGAWSKLRHRKVVQWGVAYCAATWTLLQLIDFLSGTYGWPLAVRQLATPALAFGLPSVLVIAWYHGDRGEQKVGASELAILVGLVALLGGGLWWYASRLDVSAWQADKAGQAVTRAVPQDAASVAVLPFVNMSGDPANEYFSDGLSEEILNALARIPRLYVPARTSSFHFKGRNEDVAVIAARLGVAAVLEGSVRKAGDRVRITAQLINATDGYHLWSQTYDRDLGDIFAVQEEIASAIANALRILLTAEQKRAAMVAPLTSSTEAYEAYLLGRFELNQRGEHVAKAIPYFEDAVASDPQFAVAWADLAVARALKKGLPGDRASRMAEAREAIAKAMALDPSRPEVLAAAGFVEWQDGRLDRGLELIEQSLALQPNNGEALAWRALLLGQLGRYDEKLAASYESVRRDPLSWLALQNYVAELRQHGRRAEMQPLIERLRTLDRPDLAELWLEYLAADRLDRPEAIRHCILKAEMQGADGCDASTTLASLGLREEVARVEKPWAVHLMFGEYAQALPLVRKAYEEGAAIPLELAEACFVNDRNEEAIELLEEQLRVFPSLGDEWEGVWFMSAAHAARESGQADVAKRYRDRAATGLAALNSAGYVTYGGRALGWTLLHAFDGDETQAAANAIVAIETDPLMWRMLPRLPELAAVAARPDVQAAIRAQEVMVARQRVEVLRMLCGPDPVSKTYQPAPGTCVGAGQPG